MIRFAGIVASFAVLLWAVYAVNRASRMHWTAIAYVAAQCAFAFVGLRALAPIDAKDTTYLRIFMWCFFAVLTCALCFVCFLNLPWSLIAATLAFVVMVARYLYSRIPHPLQAPVKLSLVQGSVLLICGILALLSLSERNTPERYIVACGFGVFWTAMAVSGLAWTVGVTRNYHTWISLNSWLSAAIAILSFGPMAYWLGKAQIELSHQALPEIAAAERAGAR